MRANRRRILRIFSDAIAGENSASIKFVLASAAVCCSPGAEPDAMTRIGRTLRVVRIPASRQANRKEEENASGSGAKPIRAPAHLGPSRSLGTGAWMFPSETGRHPVRLLRSAGVAGTPDSTFRVWLQPIQSWTAAREECFLAGTEETNDPGTRWESIENFRCPFAAPSAGSQHRRPPPFQFRSTGLRRNHDVHLPLQRADRRADHARDPRRGLPPARSLRRLRLPRSVRRLHGNDPGRDPGPSARRLVRPLEAIKTGGRACSTS